MSRCHVNIPRSLPSHNSLEKVMCGVTVNSHWQWHLCDLNGRPVYLRSLPTSNIKQNKTSSFQRDHFAVKYFKNLPPYSSRRQSGNNLSLSLPGIFRDSGYRVWGKTSECEMTAPDPMADECVAGGGWFNWRCGWLLLQRENRRICVAPSGSVRRITSDLEKEHWSLPGVDGRGDALLTNARGWGLPLIGENWGIVGMRDKQQRMWPWCSEGEETQWVTVDCSVWTKRWWAKIGELKIHASCNVTGHGVTWQIVLSHHWDLTWCYRDRETIRAPQGLNK